MSTDINYMSLNLTAPVLLKYLKDGTNLYPLSWTRDYINKGSYFYYYLGRIYLSERKSDGRRINVIIVDFSGLNDDQQAQDLINRYGNYWCIYPKMLEDVPMKKSKMQVSDVDEKVKKTKSYSFTLKEIDAVNTERLANYIIENLMMGKELRIVSNGRSKVLQSPTVSFNYDSGIGTWQLKGSFEDSDELYMINLSQFQNIFADDDENDD